MQVSYNWLKEYIDFKYSPDELEHVLTMAGMEVEEVEYLGTGIEDIVIGKILKVSEHPNADKLVICEVDIEDEVLNIVTAAPNVVKGALVSVAKVGVTLPNGMKIKKTKLRGEPSNGMMCSTDELGLSEERASGIMILGEDAVKGMKLVDYLNMDDYIYDLDLTPNYARCLGMIGIARELEALQDDQELKYPEVNIKESKEDINNLVEIKIEDVDLCPRYTGQIIKNVKIGPSPRWMQQRLAAGGIRPINNVVDITNYVLLEYNQPLHAFDYDKIADKRIIVRRGENGEKLVTLDGQERELNDEVLVIADSKNAVGLAGVMGGANSEIIEETTTIFLESAYFNPVNIRKTAKNLGLPSEASHRYERGIDIENVSEAGKRAAYLMQEYAGGEVLSNLIDIYPKPYQANEIKLKIPMVNKLLGLELTADKIKKMLEKLKFEVDLLDNETINVTVPAFRSDVEREADLIEEVARMYGYNNIPVSKPASKQLGSKTFKQNFEDITRNHMLAAGLDEVINFSLLGEEDYKILNLAIDNELKNWVKIKNPLNEVYAIMRTSMIPGLLNVLSKNAKRQIDKMSIFELGNVYFNGEDSYEQFGKLAAASMGHGEDTWNSGAPDFFYLKGILESFFDNIGFKNVKFERALISYLHPGRTAEIIVNGNKIGIIGEVLPDLVETLDLKERTAIFQLDLDNIVDKVNLIKKYKELPRYPASERDLALLVDKNIDSADLLKEIIEKGGKLLKDVEVFDLYQGDQIPENKKSLAFKLIFQTSDRTLRDEEINKDFTRVVKGLEEKFAAKIRGN